MGATWDKLSYNSSAFAFVCRETENEMKGLSILKAGAQV